MTFTAIQQAVLLFKNIKITIEGVFLFEYNLFFTLRLKTSNNNVSSTWVFIVIDIKIAL